MKKPIVYEVNGVTSEQRKMHGDYLLNRLYVWLLETLDKIAFTNAARVVCVSDAVKQFYSSRFPQLQDKIKVVINGVNTKLFHPLRPDDEIAGLRRRLGFDEGDEIVAYVGNFSLWQGVESLIAAVPMVLKKNPAVRFMLVGEGPTHAACVKLTEELGVSERCAFLGRVPYTSLGSYINVADVCAAPYKANTPGCPIKVYEYLACGKPVVCSDIPGIANLRDGGVLTLVEPDNPEALASALVEVLGNIEARTAQRELGPKAIMEYSWSNTAVKVADICEQAARTARGLPASD
jgi:glycosyltransferase involved in cell wall biosynthesis